MIYVYGYDTPVYGIKTLFQEYILKSKKLNRHINTLVGVIPEKSGIHISSIMENPLQIVIGTPKNDTWVAHFNSLDRKCVNQW